jgi:RES domain-containing protein
VFLWRIGNRASLAGEGGLRASGRWHTRGKRVVYCAESPAAALLEILVHFEIEIGELPARYRLLKVNAPDDLQIDRVSPTDLGPDWVEDVPATRAIGDTWLTRGRRPAAGCPISGRSGNVECAVEPCACGRQAGCDRPINRPRD